MKTLLLLRHAKSSWKDSMLADHDRPLKGRGVKAARRMGELIRERGLRPDCVVCSTALRSRETLQLVLQASAIKPAVIDFSPELYHCPPAEFGRVLRGTKPEVGCLMLVGHNPGMEEFLAQVAGRHEEFPTAALAQLELDLNDWAAFADDTTARLVSLWRPKEIGSED